MKKEKKRLFTIGLFAMVFLPVAAQEKESVPSTVTEQQLENQAAMEEGGSEDDSYWQNLEYWRKHPLNLNKASGEELNALGRLSEIQVHNFIQYRKFFGALLSIYELQAIPGWDIGTIQQLLPFIAIGGEGDILAASKKRFQGGEQTLLVRFSKTLEKPNDYQGDPYRLFFRYKYNYKNLLQYGVTGDKDAGEPFFKKPQSVGFDFYSLHLFLLKLGFVQALAIGDYTVNMGQGLIQWQSLAFRKSAAVLDVKRQGAVLKPYTASGEFNFYRGAAITVQYKKWQATVFGSFRKLSANLVTDTLQNAETFVTSLLSSGYHRTAAEISDRQVLTDISTGGSVQFRNANGHMGINTVQHHFSHPFTVSGKPYDRYAIAGNYWSNYSMDYGFTFRNLHVFGEVAADKKGYAALLHGLLISLDARTDMSIVYRRLDKAYQSLFSNAFTENTYPTNENGIYAGLSIRPANGWRIDAYADFFQFPWLKYRVDAPSSGQEYLAQVTYTPHKQAELYTRFKFEVKPVNFSNSVLPVHLLQSSPKLNWRTQAEWKPGPVWFLQSRVEMVWYNIREKQGREKGFLWMFNWHYKPALKPWSLYGRLQYFETDGYDSRIYSYESSGLYSFSIPAFFETGIRYFISASYRLSQKLPGSSRRKCGLLLNLFIGQTFYSDINSQSVTDSFSGNKETTFSNQIIMTF